MSKTRQYGKRAERALGLWVKLARAAATMARLTAMDIRTYGLTAPQFSTLETLGHLGPLALGELCQKQLVSGGNMTVVVDNLERDGLVERIPSPNDRRVIVVRLTAKGKKLFDKIFPQHARYVTELVSVLTDEERDRLAALLKKLGLALKERE